MEGTVSGVAGQMWRYSVKSMRGERLASATLVERSGVIREGDTVRLATNA